MAQALVERVKGILSSKKDDYFDPLELLDYVNEGYKSVISSAIKLEMEQPEIGARSIRALDRLRHTEDVTDIDFSDFRGYHKGTVDLNTVVEDEVFEKELYIGATVSDCPLPMSEIIASRKHKMDFGHLFPTQQRGYYEFTGQVNSQLFVYVNSTSNFTLHMSLIIAPSEITAVMETLPELPDRLIHAVVLRAALMGGVQEIRKNSGDYKELYQSELTEHLW